MENMLRRTWLLSSGLGVLVGAGCSSKTESTEAKALAPPAPTGGDPAYKPKRVNRAIELLESGQPVYYSGLHSGMVSGDVKASFAEGKKWAQTAADYISYDMEHPPYDVPGLIAFMNGLAEGGPTRSGHRTPAVIVNCPVQGFDEATVRANAWQFQQVLAAGVHGIALCHAKDAGAIKAFVESVRYTFRDGVGNLLGPGRRGMHGGESASKIWGIPQLEYEQKADPWPLNPNGEFLLGVKQENKWAIENVEKNLKIPGIGFAEWGPGDLSLSMGIFGGEFDPKVVNDPRMKAARARVFAACKANKIYFLNRCMPGENIEDLIKEGVNVIIPDSDATIEKGRRFSKRQMPW